MSVQLCVGMSEQVLVYRCVCAGVGVGVQVWVCLHNIMYSVWACESNLII